MTKRRKIGIWTIMFCYTHVLTYKRVYDYTWDSTDATTCRAGAEYYTGTDLPPYQMDILISTIVSIPSRLILDELESKGKDFQDEEIKNYAMKQRPQTTTKKGKGHNNKNMGPRVLFWGCGANTPLHAHVLEFLNGTITFIDDSEE